MKVIIVKYKILLLIVFLLLLCGFVANSSGGAEYLAYNAYLNDYVSISNKVVFVNDEDDDDYDYEDYDDETEEDILNNYDENMDYDSDETLENGADEMLSYEFDDIEELDDFDDEYDDSFDIAEENITNPKTGGYGILIIACILLVSVMFIGLWGKKLKEM